MRSSNTGTAAATVEHNHQDVLDLAKQPLLDVKSNNLWGFACWLSVHVHRHATEVLQGMPMGFFVPPSSGKALL